MLGTGNWPKKAVGLGELLRISALGLLAGLAIGAAAGVAVAGEPSNFKILKLEGNPSLADLNRALQWWNSAQEI